MIPLNIYISDDVEQHQKEIEDLYSTVAREVNGRVESYTPALSGSTTAGTVTYTTQTGWYYRQGLMVDYWFDVVWSAWAGGPAGNIQLTLPYKTFNAATTVWVGECTATSLTLANASDTFINPVATTNSKICTFTSGRHNAASGTIQVDTAGGIKGHLRYIGQINS